MSAFSVHEKSKFANSSKAEPSSMLQEFPLLDITSTLPPAFCFSKPLDVECRSAVFLHDGLQHVSSEVQPANMLEWILGAAFLITAECRLHKSWCGCLAALFRDAWLRSACTTIQRSQVLVSLGRQACFCHGTSRLTLVLLPVLILLLLLLLPLLLDVPYFQCCRE